MISEARILPFDQVILIYTQNKICGLEKELDFRVRIDLIDNLYLPLFILPLFVHKVMHIGYDLL